MRYYYILQWLLPFCPAVMFLKDKLFLMFDIPGIPVILVLTGGDNLWLGEAVFDLYKIIIKPILSLVMFSLLTSNIKWMRILPYCITRIKKFYHNKSYPGYVKQVCYNPKVKSTCMLSGHFSSMMQLEVYLLSLDGRVTPMSKAGLSSPLSLL